MPQKAYKWSINLMALFSLVLLYMIFTNRKFPSLSIDSIQLQSFKTIFLSIALEAMPFILIGVIISSFIQVYIPDRWIRKVMPRHPVAGVVVGGLLGIILPLCECGMIPVVRRLVQKGMPLYIGIVYILAGPIINPVVYASTAMAFRAVPELIWLRMGLAFVVAAAIGLCIHRWVHTNPLRPIPGGTAHNRHEHDHTHVHHHQPHHQEHDSHHTASATNGNRFASALSHISDEFFDMGKYLLLGCIITAAFQVIASREFILTVGEGMSSHLFMAVFAYLLSICSTSDAFIASSFIGTFSTGSLLTFLVFGPMLDLKNTIVMLSVFRARFVVGLSVAVLILVLLGSFVAEILFL